jgi:hypothetical protein
MLILFFLIKEINMMIDNMVDFEFIGKRNSKEHKELFDILSRLLIKGIVNDIGYCDMIFNVHIKNVEEFFKEIPDYLIPLINKQNY